MLGHVFFHDTLRKYVSTFGTLFNDIKLHRTNRQGEVIETLGVPLTYGPRDKFVTRLQADADLSKPDAITLPRISFELTSYRFDPSRMTPATNQLANYGAPRAVNTIYSMVPYDLTFQLNVYTKSNEDGVRIVEQILPFFVPQFAPTIQLLSDPDVVEDVPIILVNVQSQDLYDGAFEQRRVLVHQMDFVMKGYMIGPKIEKPLILAANTNFRISGFDDETGEPIANTSYSFERVNITPGQLANGSPTSNASLTVSANTILPNSDFGYIVDYTYDNQ